MNKLTKDKIKRASWDHNISTYTHGKPDYFLYTVMIGLIVFFSIIGLAVWLNK